MSNLSIEGCLKRIHKEQEINDRFKKREFVIETEEQYPQILIFQLVQDKTNLIDKFNIGDKIEIFFNLRGREWQKDPSAEIKVFNTLDAWRIQKNESMIPDSNAEKTTGTIAPTNNIANTGALKILIPSIPVKVTYAANKASEVKAAEAIANPFPVAAVVFPTESKISVLVLTIESCSLISATQPALSAIGPKASIASCIAVVAVIADADIATPQNPARAYELQIAAANNNTVGKVEIIPVAKPAIIFVPAPVLDCSTIFKIGFLPNPV